MSEKSVTGEEQVMYSVKMPRSLREDAQNNTQRGELADETRALFRQKAYGIVGEGRPSEVEQAKAELQEVRNQIDNLRHERSQIESKIATKEGRANRLEEKIERLEGEQGRLEGKIEMLENLLHDGEPMFLTYIKNTADVERSTAKEIQEALKNRNPDLPETAFQEPAEFEPVDWRER